MKRQEGRGTCEGEMREFVYNSGEEFELEGPVKPARDPASGVALTGGAP